MKLEAQAGLVKSKLAFKFRGSSAWSVRTAVAAGERAQIAPKMFWQFPKDVGSASYGVGADPARWTGIRQNLVELLDSYLAYEKAPRRARSELVSVIEEVFGVVSSSYVYARGALPQVGKPHSKVARLRGAIGYHLMGVSESSKRWKGMLDKLVRVYNDRQLQQLVKKKTGEDFKKMLAVRKRATRGLAGGVTYELKLAAGAFGGGEKARMAVVLILVPHGGNTWLGFSTDEAYLAKQLRAIKRGQAAETLAKRPGLDAFKSRRGVSGGFTSLEGFAGSLNSGLSRELGFSQKHISRALNSMPHHGQTPITAWGNVKGGARPELIWELEAPKEVFEDVAAMVPAIMGGALQTLKGPVGVSSSSAPPVPSKRP